MVRRRAVAGKFHDFVLHIELPQVLIRSLRTANTTLLLAAGIPLKTMSYRSKHAQTSTAANICFRTIRASDEKAAELLEHIDK